MAHTSAPHRVRILTVALPTLAVGMSMAACTSSSSGPAGPASRSTPPPSARTSVAATAPSSDTPASPGRSTSSSRSTSPGDGSGSATASAQPSAALDSSFVRRANSLCAAGNAYGKNHPFPVTNFDPTNPSPAQLPKVAKYLQGGPDVIGNLIALRPPSKGEPGWRTIVVVLRQERLNQRAQIQAAKASDPQSFSHTAQDAAVIERQLLAAARAHGLTPASDCLTYFGG